MKKIGRKEFLHGNALPGTTALTFGCDIDANPVVPKSESELPPFPYLEVNESSNYNIGYKVGEHFRMQIQQLHERLMADKIYNPDSPFNGMSLTELLLALADSDPSRYYDTFLNAARVQFPEYIDELHGMADGSGIDFKIYFSSVCFLEIIAAMPGAQQMVNLNASVEGCSTVTLSDSGRLYFAHNGDFSTPHADLMYFVKVKQSGKPDFVGLNFSDTIMSLPPVVNSAGLVFCGSFTFRFSKQNMEIILWYSVQ